MSTALELIPTPVGPPGPPVVVHGRLKATTSPLRKGEALLLSWSDESTIPRAHRTWCRSHVDRAARRLRLGHIEIRWFEPATSAETGDFYFIAEADDEDPGGVTTPELPMTVALHADIRGPIMKAIIAHEVRHVAQIEARRLLGDVAAMEADADEFALAYLAREAE